MSGFPDAPPGSCDTDASTPPALADKMLGGPAAAPRGASMPKAISGTRVRGVSAVVALGLAFATLAADRAEPSYLRMKLVKVVDKIGFEKPLTAMTVLIPTDWTFQGDVHFEPKNICTANLVTVTFRAASPDGRTSVELFPNEVWSWSDDATTRQFMQQDLQAKASFGMKGCPMGPPVAAKDFLTQNVVGRRRAGARVVSAEVDPEASRAVADQVRQLEAQAAKAGIPMRLRGDTARVKVESDRQGKPEDEWFAGVTFARGMPAPTMNAMSYTCGAEFLFGAAAPRGELPRNEKLFRAIIGSVRVDPDWRARVEQVQLNMEAANQKGVADRSRIIAQSAEDTRKIISDTNRRRQESQDRTSQNWSQAMRGVQTFRDSRTGETVELSNRHGNAWSNGKNEYLLSDAPGFDPNSVSRENWSRLEAVQK